MKEYLQRNPEVITREEEGGILLYNLETDSTYLVNPSGKVIWDLCTGQYCRDDIEKEIQKTFSVGEKTLEIIRKCTDYLLEQQLVFTVLR